MHCQCDVIFPPQAGKSSRTRFWLRTSTMLCYQKLCGGYLSPGMEMLAMYLWPCLEQWVNGHFMLMLVEKFSYSDVWLLQIRESGEVELYPISFKIFRHTTAPPPVKQSHLPWPFPAILCNLGLMSSPSPQPAPPAPILAAGAGDGSQPVIPRRVLYYQAAFDKSTTMKEVSILMRLITH